MGSADARSNVKSEPLELPRALAGKVAGWGAPRDITSLQNSHAIDAPVHSKTRIEIETRPPPTIALQQCQARDAQARQDGARATRTEEGVLPVVLSLMLAPARVLTCHVQYLDKRLFVQLNGSRKVIGVLRGYDVRPCPLRDS